MGPEIAAQCLAEVRKKALDGTGAERLNARLRALWPELREECRGFMLVVPEMERLLRVAGGATTATELGIPVDVYREAIVHSREIRNRFSVLDLADDAGMLRDFAATQQ